MFIFQDFSAVFRALNSESLSIAATLGSFACASVLFVLTAVCHELAHWAIGMLFGIKGRIGFFVRKGQSKVWYLSVLGVRYPGADTAKLQNWQIRLMAAAGPITDATLSLLMLHFGLRFPGPTWSAVGITLAGALYFATSAMNFVPMPMPNDGWLVLFPQRARKSTK